MSMNIQHIRNALRHEGIINACVCIHTSLRSFGTMTGGPNAIIDGLLAEGNTVMVPTFSNSFRIPPPSQNRPVQNGFNYNQIAEKEHDRVYDPSLSIIDQDTMGAIPAAFLQYPERIRGNHPCHSFSAIGPMADKLISSQSPMNVYEPLKELSAQNGFIILMGVGLDRLTMLHLAENLAGRRLFIRWAKDSSKQLITCQVGGCSIGFSKFESILAPIIKKLSVGQSQWIILRANQVLEAAVAAIKSDPDITHCSDSECLRCNDAAFGGPIL
jgi:aminoglycoside N3'-acetyltransferase